MKILYSITIIFFVFFSGSLSGQVPVAGFTANPTTVCEGASVAFTDASTETPTSWSWTFNGGTPGTSTAQNPVVVYNAAGTYDVTLTATNANGNNTTTSTNYITVNSLPPANAGPDQSICNGASTQLNASGVTTFSWSPVTGLSDPNISNPVANPATTTTYTVTNTSGGCSATDDVTITVNALPNVGITANPSAICAGSSTTLTASGAYSYTWSPSSTLNASTGTTVTASPNSSATYTVTGTDITGCINTANVSITVNPNPNISVTAAQDTICIGSSTTLTASGAAFYSWTPAPGLNANSGNPVMVNPTSTTTYTVTGSSFSGCSSSAFIDVIVNPVLNITTSTDTSICLGQNTQITAFASGGDGLYTYSWSPPTGLDNPTVSNPVAAPSATTVYTVTVTDNCGNPSASASVTITVNSCVSINENDEFEKMKLFPNPSSGQITVLNPKGTPVESIKIYNSLGELCEIVSGNTLTGNNLKLRLDLPAGPYFVFIYNRGESITIPLIILPGR